MNDGILNVDQEIQAKHISGKGIIKAGAISCRSVAAMDIEAGTITTQTLAAERVCAAEVKASSVVKVSCCLESARVETPKLTVAVCEVEELKAEKVVYLADREPNALWTVLTGFFRWAWAKLKAHIPVDAEYEPVQEGPEGNEGTDPEHDAPEDGSKPKDPNAELLKDFEFKRLAAMYRLLKPYGYGLRLFPLDEEPGAQPAEPAFSRRRVRRTPTGL